MRLPVWLLCSSLIQLLVAASAAGAGRASTKGAQHVQQQDPNAPSKIPLPAARTGNKQRERRHIRVVTVEAPPFMMKRPPSDVNLDNIEASSTQEPAANATDLWYGYCMDFFMELVKHLPYELTYEIRNVADRKFGSKRAEVIEDKSAATTNSSSKLNFKRVESWNGLVGELQAQRAELALAPMAVMAERELVVDFTVPFYDLVGIQILLKRPEVPQNWFKFLTVLDLDVWLSIALAYFVTSFVIYIFDRLSPYSHKNQARIRRIRERRAASGLKAQQFPLFHSQQLAKAPTPSLKLLPNGRMGGGRLASAAPNALVPLQPAPLSADELLRFSNGALHQRDSLEPRPQATTGRRPSQDYLTSLRARFARLSGGAHEPQAHEGSELNSDNDDDDEEEEEAEDGKPDFNLRDSLWFCITSLTPQGGGEAPQNLSGRVVAGAWWLFCFIVIASYTANLAAFLTVSRLDIPIESLDDLAKQYRIKYAPIDGTAEQTYFERMAYIEEVFYNIWKEMSLNESLSELERSKFSVWDYPISDKYTKIWSQIHEVAMPQSIEAALERVRASSLDDGFALLADANLIKYAVMTDCSLKAVGEEFSRKPIALALAKGHTQLRDDFSYAILQLINKRFMEVLREKWWTNNPARKQCHSNDDSEGISIENIGGVFIIILAGILLSFLVWAIERLAYNTKLDVSRNLLEQRARPNVAAGAAPGAERRRQRAGKVAT